MDGETWLDGHRGSHFGSPGTPAAADAGYYLRATVTYTDKFGEGQTASVVSTRDVVEARTTANAAPSFGQS